MIVASDVEDVDIGCRYGAYVFSHHDHLFEQVQVKRYPKAYYSCNGLFLYDCCRNNSIHCFFYVIEHYIKI
ncbi:hypothetical protein BN000_03933 [Neobacillus massiliamazoniensis]|uniref:Uncharacterized protein n=1 Tax=Neobacillus massiliamazoniensis TaxID=1499688 RepID=A0A0U1P0W3_9BACI|nr:hypothetical protein BN000_03933 [Neobacillus massiliamazoniensis]